MTVQENALKAYYTSLTDSELLKLAANRSSFIAVAQQAMTRELLNRHLAAGTAPPCDSSKPEFHGLRALMERLAHVLPGQRK